MRSFLLISSALACAAIGCMRKEALSPVKSEGSAATKDAIRTAEGSRDLLADKINRLQRICSQDLGGRGTRAFSHLADGNLYKQAKHLVEGQNQHVLIFTGFYIPAGEPVPAAETDGPVGSAQLAAALLKMGVKATIITDELNANAVNVAAKAAVFDSGNTIAVDVVPMAMAAQEQTIAQLLEKYKSGPTPVTLAYSLERVGPSPDGLPRNMRGVDISAQTASLEKVYVGGPWTKFAVGDGGNEIGMMYFNKGIVKYIDRYVNLGDKIANQVDSDNAVICGVSNWIGFTLPFAISVLRPDLGQKILPDLAPEKAFQILSKLVDEGPAVDGVTRQKTKTVDGMEWSVHEKVIVDMQKVVSE